MSPAPPASAGLRQRPLWRWARRVLLAAFLGGVAWLLMRQVQQVDWPQVWASVRAFPPATLGLAALLAAASLLLYSSFDLLGRRYTGHRLGTGPVMAVTFVSYVFNLNLGALVGGMALRYRLYLRLGLELGQVTRVMGLSMLTNWLGYLLLAGSLFLWRPLRLPADWGIAPAGLRALGAGLLLLGLGWLLLCRFSRRRVFHLRGQDLSLPSGRMAALQAILGMTNWLLLGSLLHALMPPHLDLATVTTVLLLAAVAGVITHVPAGLGVLETVFVSLLSPQVARHELLAALLTYRLLYYLAPLALATGLYVRTEWRARRRGLEEATAADSSVIRVTSEGAPRR